MTFVQNDGIIQIKPENDIFIKSFNFNKFNKEFKNQDIILVIDFLIDSNCINCLNNWTIELKKNNNYLLIVVDSNEAHLLKHKYLAFVPSIIEAVDYIQLERINKDLGL